MPLLSSEQIAAIQALEWLLDPEERRAGRTIASAIAAVRTAAAFPGRAIPILDHAGPRGTQAVVYSIREFVHSDSTLLTACRWEPLNRRQPELTLDLATPIRDWLPVGWEMPGRRPALIREVPATLDPRQLFRDNSSLSQMANHQLAAMIYATTATGRLTGTATEQLIAVEAERERTARTLWDYLDES